jgi:hypothetical protein
MHVLLKNLVLSCGHQSTQTFLPYFFPVLDLLVHVLPFFLFTLVVPPNFCYRFQPAFLASLFFNFQFLFNLVVRSLLSPLGLCNTPSSIHNCVDTSPIQQVESAQAAIAPLICAL